MITTGPLPWVRSSKAAGSSGNTASTSDPPAGARLTIKRDGRVLVDRSDIQLGFDQARGPAQFFGVYFNFDGSTAYDEVRLRFGPIRLERLSEDR